MYDSMGCKGVDFKVMGVRVSAVFEIDVGWVGEIASTVGCNVEASKMTDFLICYLV